MPVSLAGMAPFDGSPNDPKNLEGSQLQDSAAGEGDSDTEPMPDINIDPNGLAPNQPAGDPLELELQRSLEGGDEPLEPSADREGLMKQLRAHQSRADKAERMLEQIAPLANAAALLMKGQSPLGQQQQQQPPEDKAPVEPQRPMSYDQAAAYTDPTSESFKYRAALDDYTRSMMSFQAKQLEKTRLGLEGMQKQQMEELETQRAIAKAKATVMTRYRLTEQEASEFIDMFVNKQPSMDDFIAVYNVKKGRVPHNIQRSGPQFGPQSLSRGGGESNPSPQGTMPKKGSQRENLAVNLSFLEGDKTWRARKLSKEGR